MALSQELLDILACPKCKGDLHLNEKQDGLGCSACRLEYPGRDDIQIMLSEKANPIACPRRGARPACFPRKKRSIPRAPAVFALWLRSGSDSRRPDMSQAPQA